MKSGVLRLRWMFCFLFGITVLSVYIFCGAHLALALDINNMSLNYEITDLGNLNGGFASAYSINDNGQIIGEYYTIPNNNNYRHAFLYSENNFVDLGTLGGSYSSARDINKFGEIIGLSNTINNEYHGFLYSDGVMKDIGNINPISLNDKGQIVGQYAGNHAFIYNNGDITDLGVGSADSINKSGQVVVNSGDNAFLYEDGVMKDLGQLEGSDVARALAINKSGQIAGFSAWTNFKHAFLYEDGVMKDIHTLGISSDARGINDKGQIVGQSNGRAFLYTDGVMMDLRSLLAFDEGWDLIWAFDINNRGQIVGQGILNGETHAFLMTPIHKPHHDAPLKEWVGGIGGFWEE